MFRLFFILFIAALSVGCAPTKTPMTLEEMDAALAANQREATRIYPGKSTDEVRQAAQKVLYLLDPSDIEFDVTENELMATRWSTYYAVFMVGFGRDWYSVELADVENGTAARFGFAGEMYSSMFVSPIPVSFKSNIAISAHQNPMDFRLFHDRVEYLLGLRDDWPTCEMAKKQAINGRKELFLCDQIGLENKTPDVLTGS